MLILC